MSDTLDLTRRAWIRVKGDITIIGSWLYEAEDSRYRPCMVLMRTGDERNAHLIPCIITVDKAWIWEERVGDAREAARTTVQFIEALRVDHSLKSIRRLLGLIHDHLGDLLTIPPYQNQEPRPVIGELTMRRSDGGVREVEMRDV